MREHEEKEPGPDGQSRPVSRYQMRQWRQRIANDAFRPTVSLDLSKLQVIFPVRSAKAAVVSGGASFRSAASFSQQIPKLICERSCRMAKTLTVNITPILKKESRKRKKNKKKIYFPVFFMKSTRKNRFIRRECRSWKKNANKSQQADTRINAMPEASLRHQDQCKAGRRLRHRCHCPPRKARRLARAYALVSVKTDSF